ncbi:MAG: lysophospholipase [Bacteroidales bacterium]|nr:lysophospholipase [Bacteroidales bacterium]
MKNPDRPIPAENEESNFITVQDGLKIFVYEFAPVGDFKNNIYAISGITGINHKSEKDIIELLSNNKNRIVVIHPRGTGYSEGSRGDTSPESIIEDYCEIIEGDSSFFYADKKIILFGHSMSCAFALELAARLRSIDGLILVNPPYRLKPAKGMSPGFFVYMKYIGYFVFAPHSPVVNMAGDPSAIMDKSDRIESELRNNDSLLVKYFSMRCMAESKRLMDAMVENAKEADIPLLLLHGENDNIVDRSGCDEIFSVWKGQNKRFELIKGGSHGKSTVIRSAEVISKWIERL